jgi:hypothetical protein
MLGFVIFARTCCSSCVFHCRGCCTFHVTPCAATMLSCEGGLVPLSVSGFLLSSGCRCLQAKRSVYVSLEGANVGVMFLASRSLI